MSEKNPIAVALEDRFGSLKQLRQPWETLWQEIAKYVMPRRVPGLNGSIQGPGTSNETLLFDTTAVDANMTLANGQLAWMSPLEASWFAFEPQKKSDAAKLWLSECTGTAREALASGNFYTAVHEFYLDRSAFGTACLYVEQGMKSPINAEVWPVGTFVIDEDAEGNVDTVIREFQLSPRQAAAKFGEDKLSPKMREMLGDPKRMHEKCKFLHCIQPRNERDKKKVDDVNMPIQSVYMEREGCHIVKDSGYEEMPVMVSRYLQWGSGTGSFYGWAPSFVALPEARQLNFLEKMMDALAEKKAFPPVLAPEELEGEIDPNAMGVTYFSRDLGTSGQMPREWMTQGDYAIGFQRAEVRRDAIRRAFHVDLFQMFAQVEKQMTAREVSERSSEKLIQFSPTFSRLTTELFNPLLERVFAILLRNGSFTQPPEEMVMPLGDGRGFLPPPKVAYNSRIALALRALPALGYARSLERLMVVYQLQPDVLDNYNFDNAERDTALADGVPASFMRAEPLVKKTREARAEAQAQAAQMQQQAMAAESLGKVGGIKGDSIVGQQLEGAING